MPSASAIGCCGTTSAPAATWKTRFTTSQSDSERVSASSSAWRNRGAPRRRSRAVPTIARRSSPTASAPSTRTTRSSRHRSQQPSSTSPGDPTRSPCRVSTTGGTAWRVTTSPRRSGCGAVSGTAANAGSASGTGSDHHPRTSAPDRPVRHPPGGSASSTRLSTERRSSVSARRGARGRDRGWIAAARVVPGGGNAVRGTYGEGMARDVPLRCRATQRAPRRWRVTPDRPPVDGKRAPRQPGPAGPIGRRRVRAGRTRVRAAVRRENKSAGSEVGRDEASAVRVRVFLLPARAGSGPVRVYLLPRPQARGPGPQTS